MLLKEFYLPYPSISVFPRHCHSINNKFMLTFYPLLSTLYIYIYIYIYIYYVCVYVIENIVTNKTIQHQQLAVLWCDKRTLFWRNYYHTYCRFPSSIQTRKMFLITVDLMDGCEDDRKMQSRDTAKCISRANLVPVVRHTFPIFNSHSLVRAFEYHQTRNIREAEIDPVCG